MPSAWDIIMQPGRDDYALLLARLLMASLFWWSGIEKLLDLTGAAAFAASHGIPYAAKLIPFVAIFEIAAAALVSTGWRSREAAVALALWMLILGPWFHQFWKSPPQLWQLMVDDFFHHAVMIGGMIYLAVTGPGRLSVGLPRKR